MKKVLIAIIKFYQMSISPAKGTKCPYYPSCSCYGIEAVEKYGAAKGSVLAAWRVLRCNPFSKGGWDPVPEEFCIPLCGGRPIRSAGIKHKS